MKHNLTKCWYCFVRAVFATGLVVLSLSNAAAAPANRETDQIIVKPKPGRDLAALHGQGRGLLKKKIKAAESEIDVVKLPPGLAVADALAHYRGSDDVEYAEPDYVLSANAVPNDPRYSDGTLWGLHNTGQSGGRNDADI